LAALLALAPWTACQAGVLRYCDHQTRWNAAEQDQLYRFAAVVKDELERSGQRLALVARSGLDLSRFGLRYSHAGISLQGSANAPWSVRQLYYACDEKQPRIFDQGVSGFLLGTDNPREGYVSLLFLPSAPAQALEQAALDKARALQLLSPHYSANSYPYSLRYQNCNQWVMELLAAAWAPLIDADLPPPDTIDARRQQAQHWLRAQGYAPSRIEAGPALLSIGSYVPWLHYDDHPTDDVDRGSLQVSMPASIEGFVRAQQPGARRVELCHQGRQVVIHEGWEPVAEGCQPGPGDRVVMLD
jgi:hypothetical protein